MKLWVNIIYMLCIYILAGLIKSLKVKLKYTIMLCLRYNMYLVECKQNNHLMNVFQHGYSQSMFFKKSPINLSLKCK